MRWAPWRRAGAGSEAGESPEPTPVRFGTFTGVFTPTLLTIFGVIMYVRVGWSVGNAGLAGTWLVMLLAMGITTATGLSLSSIATNTRIGPGGPYAILARSLGYEVGGSIGVPLYLTRPLGVAMYIIGFREGWLWVFPEHSALVVDLSAFVVLTTVSYISAEFAFRVQFLIMAVIVGSLISMFAGAAVWEHESSIVWWGSYPGFPEDDFQSSVDFWIVFAVFFPATTGILAGANMSGDLRDPRRAIPAGTLWAIGISSVVYFAVAWWVAHAGTPEELASNYTIAIDRSLWPPIVLAGLLGATASSALAGLVGGPRILMAMGQHRIIPFSSQMAKTGKDGNPRAAVLVTSALTLVCLMARDLNIIAPLVTMFFLMTYMMLNVVVLVEGSLGLVSFRPTLRISRLVPLFGLSGCIFSVFVVSPVFGMVAVGLTVAFWIWLKRRGVQSAGEDVRSSIFISMAQWAASRVTEGERANKRAWKPDLLVPVHDPEQVRGEYQLLLDMTRPDGSVTLLGVNPGEDPRQLRKRLVSLSEAFRKDGIQSSASVVRTVGQRQGIVAGMEALQAAFFRPNLLLLTLNADGDDAPEIERLVTAALEVEVGTMIVAVHGRAGFGQRRRVNLWVRPAPDSWDAVDAFACGNLNLNLLTGYRLIRHWRADTTLVTVVQRPEDVAKAEAFLADVCDLARLPVRVKRQVVLGGLEDALDQIPIADVNVLGVPKQLDVDNLRSYVRRAHGTCIFVRDSGRESALV